MSLTPSQRDELDRRAVAEDRWDREDSGFSELYEDLENLHSGLDKGTITHAEAEEKLEKLEPMISDFNSAYIQGWHINEEKNAEITRLRERLEKNA